jgi:hypothetical protein
MNHTGFNSLVARLSLKFADELQGRRIATSLLAVLVLMPSICMGQEQKIPLTLGFANLGGSELASVVDEDRAALAPLFVRADLASPHQLPAAPVLFLYARFDPDGTVRGTKLGVRQIAQLTKAGIVVVASPNTGDSIKAALGLPGPKSANLVFTLDRKGPDFAMFFRRLFERMRQGEDMLLAWVELAPQGPGPSEIRAPETILLPERGRVAFPK